jgi:hypothetical protein
MRRRVSMRRVVAGISHCGKKRVPPDVAYVDVEDPQMLRHDGEVDHLQQRPYGAVCSISDPAALTRA